MIRHTLLPNVGHWYQDQEHHSAFAVVALDDFDQSVEIQYFAGEIGEIDIDSWYERNIQSIPPPEDWSGPFELSPEDLGNYSGSFNREEIIDFIEGIDSEEI